MVVVVRIVADIAVATIVVGDVVDAIGFLVSTF